MWVLLRWVLPQGHRSGAQNQGHLWIWLSPFATVAKSPWSSQTSFLIPYYAKMPTPVNTLWCPKQSPNINLSAGIFFVLKPRNLSTFPSLSAGCPAVLTVPTLSLLFVLNKNSLPPEMIYVLKFFSNSCSDASKSLPSLGPFSWISFTICCPLPAQRRKALSAWSFPLTSHA